MATLATLAVPEMMVIELAELSATEKSLQSLKRVCSHS